MWFGKRRAIPVPVRKAANHWRREQYIPMRKAELIRHLADDDGLAPEDRGMFLDLCALLEATFHHEFHRRLETLKDLYAPFNPDCITWEPQSTTSRCTKAGVQELVEQVVGLIQRANYVRLSSEEIQQAAAAASDWGVRLRTNFELFEQLEVYAHGDVIDHRVRRNWRSFYRPVEVDVPIYQRLVVLFRVRSDTVVDQQTDQRCVYLKLFKSIPKYDLDMLLPGSDFHMSLLDRGKILLPTLSGLAMAAAKIVQGAVLLAFASIHGLLAFLGFVGGTMGYGIKSFLGYLRTKERYHLTLTRSLYYQNLDNNAGVLLRLIDDAEEQEFREAILAYAFLRRHAGVDGWTAERLDGEVEAYLHRTIGFEVDFEVSDALAKLERLGCVTELPGERWSAVSLKEALVRLDQTWDSLFAFYHCDGGEPQAAP